MIWALIAFVGGLLVSGSIALGLVALVVYGAFTAGSAGELEG